MTKKGGAASPPRTSKNNNGDDIVSSEEYKIAFYLNDINVTKGLDHYYDKQSTARTVILIGRHHLIFLASYYQGFKTFAHKRFLNTTIWKR